MVAVVTIGLLNGYRGLFRSHLVRLRIYSEANSESRLKTTRKAFLTFHVMEKSARKT